MIVKNGEKTIGKALESVRDITFESIVVDTGSTDNTVEIAIEMGAKVYHFKWINDFSAARNFALDHTTGDWIITLDADEYFMPEDAKKIVKLIQKMHSEPDKWEDCPGISCVGINLDDNGRPMTKWITYHVFRNSPLLRYNGRIHEGLNIDISKVFHAKDIFLMHTGYSQSAHTDTGKAYRNIEILKSELKLDPDNLNLKAYLANSLSISTDEEDQAEAEELFTELLNNRDNESIHKWQKIKTFVYFINKYISEPQKISDCEDMCRKALAAFPGAVDFEYFLAKVSSIKGEYRTAWELLKSCEEKLVTSVGTDDSIMIPADPTILFSQMILTAKALGDIESVILYSTHVLTMDKTRLSILGPCIATLLHYGISEEEIIALLSNIYDFNNADDLSIIARAAEDSGAKDFAKRIKNAVHR